MQTGFGMRGLLDGIHNGLNFSDPVILRKCTDRQRILENNVG